MSNIFRLTNNTIFLLYRAHDAESKSVDFKQKLDHRIISFACYQLSFYHWSLSIVQVVLKINYVKKLPFYYDNNISMYQALSPVLFIICIFKYSFSITYSFKLNFFSGIYTKKGIDIQRLIVVFKEVHILHKHRC